MAWLYSTNAKEIGTLYLIFSIFAGELFMLALNLVKSWNYFNDIIYFSHINKVIIFIFNLFITIKNELLEIKPAEFYILRDFTQEYLIKKPYTKNIEILLVFYTKLLIKLCLIIIISLFPYLVLSTLIFCLEVRLIV